MIRMTTFLWAILALLMGYALFLLKYEVQTVEDQLASTRRLIRDDQRAIHVLKAEWSYLNDPARVRGLSEKLLGMEPMSATAFISIDDLPFRAPPSARLPATPPKSDFAGRRTP